LFLFLASFTPLTSYSLLGTAVLLSNSSDGNFSSLASVFFVTGGLGAFAESLFSI
jgi:hypothetical protein